ncbi:MAG: M56 family metallopeptidase [Acidobacteriota bacterium]
MWESIDTVVRVWLEAISNGIWQGLAIVALTYISLRLTGKSGASTRFAICLLALLTISLLPLLLAILTWSQAESIKPLPVILPAIKTVLPEEKSSISSATTPPILPVQKEGDSAVLMEQQQVATTRVMRIEIEGGRWLRLLVAIWLAIALLFILRLGHAYWLTAKLKHNASPLNEQYQQHIESIARQYGIDRKVTYKASQEIKMPMMIGLSNVAILFPATLLEQLTLAEFEQIALHELAHVRRCDDWTNLLQRFIEAILFFHPAIWWLVRRLDLEREIACDEWVVTLTGECRSYATCLLRLVELTATSQAPILAAGATRSKRQITTRIETILNRPGQVRLSKLTLAIAMTIMIMAIVQFTQAAKLIHFIEPRLQTVTASVREKIGTVSNISAYVPVREDKIESTNPAVVATRERSITTAERVALAIEYEAPDTTKDQSEQLISATQTTAKEEREKPAYTSNRFSSETLIQMLAVAADMSSDTEKGSFLIKAVEFCLDDTTVLAAFSQAANTISSDSEKGRVLTALLAHSTNNRNALSQTLNVARGIASDSVKGTVLAHAAGLCRDDAMLTLFLKSAATITSDTELARVLLALLNREGLSKENLRQIEILANEKISSTSAQQRVLAQIEVYSNRRTE